MLDSTLFSRRIADGRTPGLGLRRLGEPDLIFFGGGLPDPAVHPAAEIGRLFGELVNGPDRSVLTYGYEKGDARLREIVAARCRAEGGALTAEEIVLTNGSAGAIGLVAAALIEPGDVAIVEAATYNGALKAFRQMGAEIAAAPIDAEGLEPGGLASLLERLARDGRRTKLIYTIATCHNPTATILSLERRRAISRLAERHGALVVEDHTYGDIRFGPTPPPFVVLDPARAIHLGSFSKTIAPGLRVGWAAARPDIAAALAEVRTDLGTSPLLQRLVARFIEEGLFDLHLREVTRHYRRKRDLMLAGLERHCRGMAEWRAPEGGFFIWLTLKTGDVRAAIDAAEQEKVAFIPGPYFAAEPGTFARSFRLSYGETPEDVMEEGLERLGRALARVVA